MGRSENPCSTDCFELNSVEVNIDPVSSLYEHGSAKTPAAD